MRPIIGLVSYRALTLSAFASELYPKCLLCVETGSAQRSQALETSMKSSTDH